MASTATGSKAHWAPLARRAWAGAGPQRAAGTGPPVYSLLLLLSFIMPKEAAHEYIQK